MNEIGGPETDLNTYTLSQWQYRCILGILLIEEETKPSSYTIISQNAPKQISGRLHAKIFHIK